VRRFTPALRRISSELPLPEPTRARILLEMVADLEALLEHYRARGLDEEEAARRAEERLLASPEALEQLVAVHTTAYQRWVSRAAGRLRWGFDALLFAVGVLPIVGMAGFTVLVRLPGAAGSFLLWPLLGVATAIAGIALTKAYQLFVRHECATARLHRGLPTLVFLGAFGSLLGIFAALLGLYRLAMALMGGSAGVAAQVVIAEQAGRDATLFGLGLLLGFGAALVWFVLVNRLATIERAESAALLGTLQE
jgi:hypothetical protein